ncbi:MAG: hypothetical protein S4CHLAM20_07290 [Chlamydiia bacterium]|nr:hypothetical protein [Chlamydiia bacterium]
MILFLLLISALFGGESLKPQLGYHVHDQYLQTLHSIFPSLDNEEIVTDWGKEYSIGLFFAKELDLYQAITAFKRAAILIPEEKIKRRREIDYQIINAYYLGGRYKSVIQFFDHSLLANIKPGFAAFHDLLIILYDSMVNEKLDDRADRMLKTMEKYFPYEKKKIDIATTIISGELDDVKLAIDDDFIETSIAQVETSLDAAFYDESNGQKIAPERHYTAEKNLKKLSHLKECKAATKELFNDYQRSKKNPILAGGLNAICPGLGYLYLGQKQSALTALLLNSLTTAAAYYFYKEDNIPAAALTLSFESGWYFGGIYGAKEEAQFYNTRLYEQASHYRMRDHKLYPILMLRHGF